MITIQNIILNIFLVPKTAHNTVTPKLFQIQSWVIMFHISKSETIKLLTMYGLTVTVDDFLPAYIAATIH